MERRAQESVVGPCLVVERIDEARQIVLGDCAHFVFALINGTFNRVGFVVIHCIADREATHEIGDTWLVATQIFFDD